MGIKMVPATVVLAGSVTILNPLHPPYRYDVMAYAEVWGRLPGMRPVCVKQQPCRHQPGAPLYDLMQDRSLPWRVRDDHSGPSQVLLGQESCVMPFYPCRLRINIVGRNALRPHLQMLNQIP
jgi:hypothetical protein